ncbi:hypothetical protein OKW96_11420 [Sphingobacterium sp. KU25419]|nr:hypothetical protein OKW96_11420 [Sphingobacterium sp. KU25419]
MKVKRILYFLFLFHSFTYAQESLDFNAKKNITSPEVNGKTVTFRLFAPQAKTVKLQGNWMDSSPVDLQKVLMESGLFQKQILPQIFTPIHF